MKILLDEGVPEVLRNHFPGHDVKHVVDMGWRSILNGELMRLAESEGFEIFVTVDKGIPHQQNIGKRSFCVVVLDVLDNSVASCVLASRGFESISNFAPGSVVWLKPIDD